MKSGIVMILIALLSVGVYIFNEIGIHEGSCVSVNVNNEKSQGDFFIIKKGDISSDAIYYKKQGKMMRVLYLVKIILDRDKLKKIACPGKMSMNVKMRKELEDKGLYEDYIGALKWMSRKNVIPQNKIGEKL